MTESKDSAETEMVGYVNDGIVNINVISNQLIEAFRAELLKILDEEIEKEDHLPGGIKLARNIVANHSF